MIDEQGEVSYSRSILVKTRTKGLRLERIYPQPTIDLVKVQWYSQHGGLVRVEVFSADGTKLLGKEKKVSKGSQFLELDCDSWQSGMYIIKLNQGGESVSRKILKQ